MKQFGILTLCAAIMIPPGVHAKHEKAPQAASPETAAIRKVFVTGMKKHGVSWARKRLGCFTCVESVNTIEEADAILDLEPVEPPASVEIANDPTGVVTCRSRSGPESSEVSCSDSDGATEKVVCHTTATGDTTCRSYYLDLAPLENALYNSAQRSAAAAQTHAYLLNKDNKKVLWEYDESLPWHQSLFHPARDSWEGQLKYAVGCAKHERGDRHK